MSTENTVMYNENDILLIEDSPTQAIRFKMLLSAMGYNVHLASDGREGWCEACSTRPTLILLDFNLPSLNGLQVLSRLKRDHTTSSIPVVMLSDHDHALQVEQALELGAKDYLFKADYMRQDGALCLQHAIEQVLHTA